jgi:cytochrome c oxidase subunit 2
MDAIAGQTNILHFKPEKTGTWVGQCAELCGVQHAVMYTRVTVLDSGAYESWVQQQASMSAADLGKEVWTAVCAKCHGFTGQGLVGPPIAGKGTLANRQGLIKLLSQGQDTAQFPSYMPPVGIGWNGHEYDSLIAYIKATPELSGKGQTQSGG